MSENIPDYQQIKDIPTFMESVSKAYNLEVPLNLDSSHPLSDIWNKPITVTEGTSPDPRYSATGEITEEFPFNFSQSSQLQPVMNLKIELFQPPPNSTSLRGVKVTVFHVPNSTDVIVSHDQDVPPEITNG